jgi:hypothetical protein
MRVMRIFPLTVGATFLFFILASAPAANETKPPELKLAAAFQLPQLPGLSGPSADWRQWDAFFTFVVKQFGQELSGDLKDSLGKRFWTRARTKPLNALSCCQAEPGSKKSR